jgi:hypothetical protein
MSAAARALEDGRPEMTGEDLLIALTRDATTASVLAELGVDEAAIRGVLARRARPEDAPAAAGESRLSTARRRASRREADMRETADAGSPSNAPREALARCGWVPRSRRGARSADQLMCLPLVGARLAAGWCDCAELGYLSVGATFLSCPGPGSPLSLTPDRL